MHKFLNTLKNIDIEINVLFFYYFCVAFAWLFHGYIFPLTLVRFNKIDGIES